MSKKVILYLVKRENKNFNYFNNLAKICHKCFLILWRKIYNINNELFQVHLRSIFTIILRNSEDGPQVDLG